MRVVVVAVVVAVVAVAVVVVLDCRDKTFADSLNLLMHTKS